MAHKFQFLRETKIRKERYDFSRWHSCHLRSKLPKGIYWTQTTDGGCILSRTDANANGGITTVLRIFGGFSFMRKLKVTRFFLGRKLSIFTPIATVSHWLKLLIIN
jgi:hypothetical protein